MSALLHDVIDDKLTDKHHALSELHQFLKIELDDTVQKNIIFIIKHLSYRNGRNNDVTLPIEGQIVRDADRLDAIGAIGIARTFQFSGHFNEPMWTESPIIQFLQKKIWLIYLLLLLDTSMISY